MRPLLLLKSDTVTRRPCIAGANQTSDNPLFGQLLVVVQGSSDAGDELDASSFGITEKAVLAGIARSQRPASIVPPFALPKEKSSIFVTTA